MPEASIERATRIASRYLRVACGSLAVAVAVLAGFNLLVDPYRAYRLAATAALDPYKNTGMSSRTKSEAVRRGGWEAFLVGSSRTEVGLDPHHPALRGRRAYNLGLSDTNALEVAAALRYALESNDPDLVVFLADAELFGAEEIGPDLARSRFHPAYGLVEYHASNLAGMQATEQSITSLLRFAGAQPAYHSPFGRMIAPMKPPEISHRELFERSLRWRMDGPALSWREDAIAPVEEMIAACLRRGVRLLIATPPLHALLLELFHRRGAWGTVERWKRDLAAAVERQNEVHAPARPAEVWDFAGFWSYNTEAVPPAADVAGAMRWHWEATHFKKELGDVLLARLLAGADGAGAAFGVRLRAGEVEPHLAAQRTLRERWAKTHADQVELLDRLEAAR
jgi:hypothetical protein